MKIGVRELRRTADRLNLSFWFERATPIDDDGNAHGSQMGRPRTVGPKMTSLPQAIAEIRARRRAGMTITRIRDLALASGIVASAATINRVCSDIPPRLKRPGRKGADPATRAAVRAAWLEGRTAREIAATYGVALSTVWLWTKIKTQEKAA